MKKFSGKSKVPVCPGMGPENQANRPVYNALLKRGKEHPIEEVGEQLRGMMPWLHKDKLVDQKKN